MRKYLISFVGGLVILCIMTWLIVTFMGYHEEIRSLPLFTFSTVFRITITLLISVAWGVSFGILAATNKWASLILTPFIDLLQSIPILGYFPMVIGFLFLLGPLGIELSVIILLFTSMAWAIFFGVLGAVRGIPTNVAESARSFGLTRWRYVRHVILPAITPAVVSGANLAWCDGWFFMIAAEYIQYKGQVVTPPSGGLGSLLAKAAYEWQDMNIAIVLLIFITFIVVYFNTLTWHRLMERASTGTFKPVFRMDLSGVGKLGVARATSWLHFGRLHWPKSFSIAAQRLRKYTRIEKIIAAALTFAAIFIVVYSVFGQFPTTEIIRKSFVDPNLWSGSTSAAEELGSLPLLIAMTMGRLTIAYGISLVVAIGMGVLAAEHKKFATVFYPLYDIGQGVPILALFPVLFLGLNQLIGDQRIALEFTCIIMLVLDMIWYMFLNIVSAVKNIPTEINEVGHLFGFKGLKRIMHIIIPSILPSIVTGSILSWGTGWNTIIFAEYMPSTEPTIPPLSIPGLGSLLDKAGYEFGNTVVLIFLLGVVAIIVLSMEGLIWRRLLRKFEKYHVEVYAVAVLAVANVSKTFMTEKSKILVLDNVSFSVGKDEFVCLVGPSGCGKSTMLRIIAGLEHVDCGRILFHNESITKPTPKIAMIFQLFGLLPWKTALENVEVPLEVLDVEKEQRKHVAEEYLKMVGLEGFENTYPHDLSGGMKQRVGIARALALKPEILLMDEPFSSLDELTAKTLRELVLDIWRNPALPTNTFIMVSHNVEEAVYMADRVIVMSPRPGKVIGEVRVDLPRPRTEQLREAAYFEFVDKVVELLEKGKVRVETTLELTAKKTDNI